MLATLFRFQFAGDRRQPLKWWLAFVLLAPVVLMGCGTEKSNGTLTKQSPREIEISRAEREKPEGALKLAVRAADWPKAWKITQIILEQNNLDPATGLPTDQEQGSNRDTETASQQSQPHEPNERSVSAGNWSLMANAAHETNHLKEAAYFLSRACELEQFSQTVRVQQTLVAMIEAGMLFDGIDLLNVAVQFQPDNHELRRLLFDLYVGVDDRIGVMQHGKFLVRARKFDTPLLISLANTEQRRDDDEPLKEMVKRNPEDKRPLVGVAKIHFDERDFEKAISVLTEICEKDPHLHSAQSILGRTYAASGKFDSLENWVTQLQRGIESYPGYWIALGDWAMAKGQTDAAIRSFAEATQTPDPDVIQSWTRLATLLPRASALNPDASNELIESVQQRAKQLGSLSQLVSRFDRTGKISRLIALQIAQTLQSLGRLWEAEAWSAIATTLPPDDEVDLNTFRQSIAVELKKQPPWQQLQGHPEFSFELSAFPLPSIEQIVASESDGGNDVEMLSQDRIAPPFPKLRMEDEAKQRGLQFFGRTGDTLDQPGVMLYQTLGCGGGTIDYDLDGWPDLYFTAAGGTPPESDSSANELFRNQEGQYVAFGYHANVADRGFGQGVAVGDVNQDGFQDLLILNYGPNRLFLNQGDGTFRDSSASLPTQPYDEWSSSAAIADIDDDGLADVCVVNYCGGLGPVTQTCNARGTCSPMLFAGLDDQFIKCEPDGRLRDVNQAWLQTKATPGRGLGIVVGALDQRPGNDLFIANDMTHNHYYSRDPSQTPFGLSETAMARGLGGDDQGIAQGSMGIAAGDFDDDADLDFYVTNFDKEYNTLHRQDSPGVWQDKTAAADMIRETLPLVGFGTEAIDINNDGRQEIIIVNGHVDIFSRGDQRVQYAQPLQLFHSAIPGRFHSGDTSSIGRYFAQPHVGRSLWTIDANRDGQIDLVTTHQTEPVALLINQSNSQNHWIRLQLIGTQSARDAVGATVTCKYEDQTRTAFRLAGSGYQCSNETMLHFGLGDEAQANVTIEIQWPSGMIEQFTEIESDRTLTLVEGLGQPVSKTVLSR